MAKDINPPKPGEVIKIEPERSHFQFMLAKNPNYFGNIPNSKIKPNLQLITQTSYEELTCVGYNPDTENMEATFSIKKTAGYSGNLCAAGSFEHIRFYLDFHDGAGFIDQGSVAINVHDIPGANDCTGGSIFPISYVATQKKITSKLSYCDSPLLPTLRAILSWSIDPPANSPNWVPVWGNVLNCDVQLKPHWKFNLGIDLSKYLAIASDFPYLSSKQVIDLSGIDQNVLNPMPPPIPLVEMIKKAQAQKVPASRFAFKAIDHIIKYPSSEISVMNKAILDDAKIESAAIIDQLAGVFFPVDTSKANVDYEELECVGLDYNTESLVATIQIKKNVGYSGDLCDPGSTEYIAFWIDWDNDCKWEYLNTVQLNVHDIKMVGNALCYSVTLPLDTLYHHKLCTIPNVIRVRGVLSWNVPPSTVDPNKLEFYGNRVDTHIQIKPGLVINPGDVIPLFNIIGGIDVSHVDDVTGLTKPGSFFAFNGLSVPTGAPFGGVIVINGPTFPGYRYKIKVTNLTTMVSYYLTDSFTVVGWLPFAPWVQFTTQAVDGAGYYPFLPPEKNTLNVLARFTPGTEDKLLVEMEVDTIAGTFWKIIQMDNTVPVIQLQVDDGGDCTHYTKGDTITGHYYANDKHMLSWSFATTWGGNTSGTSNTAPLPGDAFSVVTPANAYPCGDIALSAVDKTIVNSQSVGFYAYTQYNICLQDKKK
jgi:hypothetical protein